MELTLSLLAGGGMLLAATTDLVSQSTPFGWLGSILLAMLGAFTLHKAGSVKAWKETAEARAERLEDVERELAELRVELKIPERIEGILQLIGEMAVRQDAAAAARLEEGFARLDHLERLASRNAELIQANTEILTRLLGRLP